MNELEIRAISAYADEFLFEPGANWPKFCFDRRSYARWAVTELLTLIMDRPFVPAELTIEAFAIKCGWFTECFATETTQNFIFSIARDTANDILDVLRAMN